MSTQFYPGNSKLIGIAKQADKDTPAATPDLFLQVTNYSKDPVRAQAPLNETDRSAQQGANHVTGITPGCSFDCYGRPGYMPTIAEALLWLSDEDVTNGIFTAEPSQTPVYWTVWEIEPGLYTDRYDGCVGVSATFTAQDEGETELKVTGLTFIALAFTAHVAEPMLPAVDDEVPFIFAEVAVKYATVHLGTTSAFTVNVNRNAKRITGDNGFSSLDVSAGKLQVDGTITRYVQDDDTKRAVDTGSAAGTTATTTIYDEAIEILFDRVAESKSFKINSAAVAYPTREQAINLDGSPLAEVLGFQTQPQADAADNITITSEA
jgi:hypothetical protein